MHQVTIGFVELVGILAFVAGGAASAAATPTRPAPAAPIVTLTWQFATPNTDDTIEQHVALRVTQGSASKTYKLQRMMGSVDPMNQPFCRGTDAQYPLEKGEVAKITFYEGGARGYYAKRSGSGASLQIYSFAMTDGLCAPSDGCHQPKDKFIRRIPISAHAKLVEAMQQKAAGAPEFTPFTCTPSRQP